MEGIIMMKFDSFTIYKLSRRLESLYRLFKHTNAETQEQADVLMSQIGYQCGMLEYYYDDKIKSSVCNTEAALALKNHVEDLDDLITSYFATNSKEEIDDTVSSLLENVKQSRQLQPEDFAWTSLISHDHDDFHYVNNMIIFVDHMDFLVSIVVDFQLQKYKNMATKFFNSLVGVLYSQIWTSYRYQRILFEHMYEYLRELHAEEKSLLKKQ